MKSLGMSGYFIVQQWVFVDTRLTVPLFFNPLAENAGKRSKCIR